MLAKLHVRSDFRVKVDGVQWPLGSSRSEERESSFDTVFEAAGIEIVNIPYPILSRQVLGGIIRDYYREAAWCPIPPSDKFLNTTPVNSEQFAFEPFLSEWDVGSHVNTQYRAEFDHGEPVTEVVPVQQRRLDHRLVQT